LENNPINLLQIIFISMHVNLTTKWVIWVDIRLDNVLFVFKFTLVLTTKFDIVENYFTEHAFIYI
jgi:hypothetical protein